MDFIRNLKLSFNDDVNRTTSYYNSNLTNIEEYHFVLTFALCALFYTVTKVESLKTTNVFLIVIALSFVLRASQYAYILVKDKISITTLFCCYMTHFILFASCYHINYIINGSDGFTYLGGPPPGSTVDNTNAREVASRDKFVKDIDLNIYYYTAVTSFTVGYGDIVCANPTFKMINLIQLFDSTLLLTFLFNKL
jgi:hypothetical protein